MRLSVAGEQPDRYLNGVTQSDTWNNFSVKKGWGVVGARAPAPNNAHTRASVMDGMAPYGNWNSGSFLEQNAPVLLF